MNMEEVRGLFLKHGVVLKYEDLEEITNKKLPKESLENVLKEHTKTENLNRDFYKNLKKAINETNK